MDKKLTRLVIFIVGFAILAGGIRLIYLRYRQSAQERRRFSGESAPGDEGDRNPYLRGKRVSRSDINGSGGDAVSAVPSPSPFLFSITTEDLVMGILGEDYRQVLEAKGGKGRRAWKVVAGELPPGLNLGQEGIISGRPGKEGEWRFTVTVEDREGRTARKELRLLIRKSSLPPEDLELSILTTTLAEGSLGRDYLQEIKVAGGEPPYGWSLVEGNLPESVLLNKENGVLYGIPRKTGTFSFTIRVTDATGEWVEMSYRLRIVEGELEIVTAALPPAVQREEYSLKLQAKGGVSPYRWELIAGKLPLGIELDREGGILHGVCEWLTAVRFTIQVKGAGGREAEKEFTLEVVGKVSGLAGRRSDLRIVTTSLNPATRGQLYSQRLKAEGGRPPYVWTVSQGDLPPSLFLDGSSGEIAGVPEKEGKYVFTVLVSDENGATAQARFSLSVNFKLVYITTGTLATAVIGEVYRQQIEVTGGTTPYLWSLDSGSLPGNLHLDSASGLIQGHVSESYLSGGTQEFVFRVKAADQAGNYDIAELRLTVRATAEPTPLPSPSTTPSSSPSPTSGPGLQITTDSLPEGRVGESYRSQLSATGGVPPYKWSLTGLPAGLSSTEEGVISGIPETAADYSIEVEVTDSEYTSASRTLTLSVKSPYAEGVSNLIAAGGEKKVGLAWTNPVSDDFEEVVIWRKIGSYPQNPGDGQKVYQGTGDNILDSELSNGLTYFYAVVTYDENGYPSELTDTNRIYATPAEVSLFGANDPYADEVVSFNPLSLFGQNTAVTLGAPMGMGLYEGSEDVVSLHARVYDGTSPCGGNIILKFSDNFVVDEDGDDFTVFENAFKIKPEYSPHPDDVMWMEPGIVSVSQDGKAFYTFSYNYVPHYYEDGSINLHNPYSYQKGFAGVNPVYSNNGSPDPTNPAVSGGDSFDLNDITEKKLTWIQYIKVTATGDGWLTDSDGDSVRHTQIYSACSGAGSSGFDLDAVCAVNY